MISLSIARKLKAAGLQWKPTLFDFFAIPDREMDERVFVISDMPATVERYFGTQVVSFQGASEWALDSLVTSEAIWLPSEAQLRGMLEDGLIAVGAAGFRLSADLGGYTCELLLNLGRMVFRAQEASEAYALALLYLMNDPPPD